MLEEDDGLGFADFLASVQEEEKDEAQNSQNQKGFEFPECAQIKGHAIVRFVKGIPETTFDKDKSGTGRAKIVNTGWVKDDEGKFFPLILPAVIKGKPHEKSAFLDFIDKVLTKVWVQDPNDPKKGAYNYIYSERDDYGQQKSGEKTLKEIFWDVFKSGKTPQDMYYESQRSWRGKTVYIANVIDRLDYKWHQEHKKTKLLMSKITTKGDRVNHSEISYYLIGAPLAELANNHGTKLDYDVLIVPNPKDNKEKYKLTNVTKLKGIGYWDDIQNIVPENERELISTTKGFTEEEASWESVDIEKYYHYTSAATLLKHFGKTIKNFDMMVGTNFYDELKAEADADAAYRKAKGEENTASQSTSNVQVAAPQPAVQATVPVSPSPTVQVSTQAAPVAPQATAQSSVQPQPTAQANVQTSFDTMTKVEKPDPIPVTEAAKSSIQSFYDSLDD